MTEKIKRITKENLSAFESSVKQNNGIVIKSLGNKLRQFSQIFIIKTKTLIKQVFFKSKNLIKTIYLKLKKKNINSIKPNVRPNNLFKAKMNISPAVMKKRSILIFLPVFVISLLITYLFLSTAKSKIDQVRLNALAEYYMEESEAYFDPVNLRDLLDKNEKNYVLVDVRREEDFQTNHIKTAINIPIYFEKFQDSNWHEHENQILKAIKKESQGKNRIVIYGYQENAKPLLELAGFLNTNKLNVQILSINFYQFRDNFYQWLPGAENGGLNMDKYLVPKQIIQ